MRLWLLLVSLLVSDMSPLGDGDCVMENYNWIFYRKQLLNGQMSPLGPEILQPLTEHCCMSAQRQWEYVAVLHKQRTSPSEWAYTVHHDHGCTLTHLECRGAHWIPARVVFHLGQEGKSSHAFLLNSDILLKLPALSQIPPANGETSHITEGTIKYLPESGSAWLLHHMAASCHNSQPSSLERSNSWAPSTFVQLQKMLRKRLWVAASCCVKMGEVRLALAMEKISKQEMAQLQISLRATDNQILMAYSEPQPSPALPSKQEIFQAAALHPASSSKKTSDQSQLQFQRNAGRLMKINERWNSDEGSLLQKRVQRQLFFKTKMYNDGVNVLKRLLLVSREKTEDRNRPQYKMGACEDDNKEEFSGKTIPKQDELRHSQGGSETEQSNTIENGEVENIAYIQRVDFTHEAHNYVVDHKQVFPEEEEVSILLFLPDGETETPSSEVKRILNLETMWENVPKELYNSRSRSITHITKEIFIFASVIYAPHNGERMDIKTANKATKVKTVSAHMKEQSKVTTKMPEITPANSKSQESMELNLTKQEENISSEESVIPSPPSLKIMETAQTETRTVNLEIKETSNTQVFNQVRTERADRLQSRERISTTPTPPECETEPGFRTSKTPNKRVTNEKSLSGLRMKEDFLSDMAKLQKATKSEKKGSANRPATGDHNYPNLNPFPSLEPSDTTRKQAKNEPQKTAKDNGPPCRGLIHRSEAGWKHCMESSGGTESKTIPSEEPMDAFKESRDQQHSSIKENRDNLLPNNDGYDHFYYFDGVMRRVESNLYPYYKRQRRKRSSDDSVFIVKERGNTHSNPHSFMQRLTLRNKASPLK